MAEVGQSATSVPAAAWQLDNIKATPVVFTHNLGMIPRGANIQLQCRVANANFTVGQVLDVTGMWGGGGTSASSGAAFTIEHTATTSTVLANQSATANNLVRIPDGSTGALTALTDADWYILLTVNT